MPPTSSPQACLVLMLRLRTRSFLLVSRCRRRSLALVRASGPFLSLYCRVPAKHARPRGWVYPHAAVAGLSGSISLARSSKPWAETPVILKNLAQKLPRSRIVGLGEELVRRTVLHDHAAIGEIDVV